MGLKRKASVLEDVDTAFHLEPYTDTDTYTTVPATPSLTSLSSPSSASTTRSAAEDDTQPHHLHPYPYNFWKVDSIPYLNSRTRKRYRDGRPDEETIYENTLSKLYAAQRLHLDEAAPMPMPMPMPDESMCFVEHSDYGYGNGSGYTDQGADADAEMLDDVLPVAVAVDLPRTAQRNQRTIDAFFGPSGNVPTTGPVSREQEQEQERGQGHIQTRTSIPPPLPTTTTTTTATRARCSAANAFFRDSRQARYEDENQAALNLNLKRSCERQRQGYPYLGFSKPWI